MPKYNRCVYLLWLIMNLAACMQQPTAVSETRDATPYTLGTQTPIPGFLKSVYPAPGSQSTQDAYTTGTVEIEDRLLYPLAGAVCVNLTAANLLERNDRDFSTNDYLTRSNINVRTLGPNPRDVARSDDTVIVSVAGGTLKDERGNEVGGTMIFCWQFDLTPSVYEAAFDYLSTSGYVLSYRWSFEIIE